jgi:hypothetical protein
MKRTAAVLSQVLLGLSALAAQDLRAATPAVHLESLGATFETAGQYTLGFQFMVTEAVRVVSLGAFDHAGDGLASGATVTLWRDEDGSPLASAQVPAGAAATLLDGFRYTAIAPVTLTPGLFYVVGAWLPAGEATSFNIGGGGSTGSFDSRLTNLMDRNWDDGYDFPLGSDGIAGGAWLGANFQLTAVPEPASAGLLAAGLLGAALWRRRRGTAGPRLPQN